MKTFDIERIVAGIDFSDIRWGVPYKVDKDTVMYMHRNRIGYRVEVAEQSEGTGWYVNVIGEALVAGTGYFEDDLQYCIELALDDANEYLSMKI